MDIEPGFPCPKCGADTQVFYSSKTGDHIAWSCPNCKTRGYFRGSPPTEKAILIENGW